MVVLIFLIALTALVIAIMAYKKAGGSSEDLSRWMDSIQQKASDALSKVEKSIRGEDKKEE
jgi:hypothetical protein